LSTAEKLGVCELAPLLPVAPEEAPAEPLLPEALGVELLLPVALGVELLPEAPVELLPDAEDPPLALSEGLLSVALVLEPLDPDAPLLVLGVLELCASATLASAKSAAAVAVPTTLNNI
jgi:hypothetical protein